MDWTILGKFFGGWLGLLATLLASLGTLLSGGCVANDLTPKAFPQELGLAANALVVSMTDQAAWDEMLGKVDGHVSDPGVETYIEIRASCGVRLRGVDGSVAIAGTGHGTGPMTDQARAVFLEQYESATSKAQRDYWLKLLGKTEAEPDGVPPADPGDGSG